jgi:hypothetical protein
MARTLNLNFQGHPGQNSNSIQDCECTVMRDSSTGKNTTQKILVSAISSYIILTYIICREENAMRLRICLEILRFSAPMLTDLDDEIYHVSRDGIRRMINAI